MLRAAMGLPLSKPECPDGDAERAGAGVGDAGGSDRLACDRLAGDRLAGERIGAAAFVLSLRARGIFDTGILRALETVPRDHFAPRRFVDLARADVALPLACGQTMTAPATVATMLVALAPSPGDRVLEIGTGSGYVSALLSRLGCRVTSVERQTILADAALDRLASGGFGQRVEVFCGDGLRGGPGEGRFDRILINGTLAYVPPAVTSRLAVGGRLVGALVSGSLPRLLVMSREVEGTLHPVVGKAVRLAPLVANAGPESRPETEI